MTRARLALATTASALLCFLVGGFFLSPLSRGVANEVQDTFGLYAVLGWVASHAVGVPAGVLAWRSAGGDRASLGFGLLTVAHAVLLFVSGAIAGFLLLLSGSHFH